MSPFPDVCITVFPVFISLIAISGCTNAILVTTSSIYPDSVKSFFRNLYLTGVLKNKFSIVILVPFGHPASCLLKIFPPSAITSYPVLESAVFDNKLTFAIAAILMVLTVIINLLTMYMGHLMKRRSGE